jgi:hypothetical protein
MSQFLILCFWLKISSKYLYLPDNEPLKIEVRIIKLSEYSIEHLINHDI